jgi:TonB-linked SusC/RagA family outer membrane protein
LDELVVIGYGEQRRAELTGSISSISRREITEQPVYNIEQALQGLAAGVRVEADGYRPGEGATISVRGIRSFVASNDPLIVLDGVPIEGGLQDINTRNIESIEILKDASATAIYGSRGANGVILITTQRGFEGRTTVQYSGFTGIQTIAKKVDYMSGERYAEMKREAHKVQGTYTGNDADMFESFELRGLEQGISTNWQDLVWERGFQQDHQLTVTGGDTRTRYYLSGGFQDHLAIAPNNDFARYSGQVSLDHQVTDWLRLDLSTQISRSIRHEAGSMSRTVRINPLAVPYDEDGNLIPFPAGDIFQENPLFDYDRRNYEDRRERTRILGSLVANVDISENFIYRLTFAPDWTFRNEGRFRGSNTVARQFGTSDARVINQDISNYLLDNLLEYHQTLADRHSIRATLLYSLQSYSSEFRSIEVEDLPYEHQRFYNIGTGEQVNSRNSSLTEWLLESTMARLNYNFDDRYLLTLTGRLDGSTRFAEGYKYGFFPSMAVAWNISNESFMQEQQLFDMLRLRLSYGVSGNTAIAAYQSQGGLDRVPYSFGNRGVFGFEHDAIANPDLRWESTSQINLGLEFGILDNRVNADLNFYRANTDDLLMNRALPTTSGFTSVVENIGGTRNTGLEMSLSTENIRTERFLWSTNINFSTNRNEITELFG